MQALGAGVFVITAILFSLGLIKQLRLLLSLVCVTHIWLFISYNPNCPTCYVIFLLEVILLLSSFRVNVNRNIQTTAAMALIFLCIGIFFSFKVGLFTINMQAIQKQKLAKESVLLEAAIPNGQKDRNEIVVQDEQGREVKVTGPVLFFAWW